MQVDPLIIETLEVLSQQKCFELALLSTAEPDHVFMASIVDGQTWPVGILCCCIVKDNVVTIIMSSTTSEFNYEKTYCFHNWNLN